MLYTLQLLDLEHIYELKALSLLHDFYHNKLPPFFKNKITFYKNRHNELLLKIHYRRTNIASSSPFNTLPNIWNPLPIAIKSLIKKSKSTFLREFKNHIFKMYESWICHDINCYVCKKVGY